MAYLHLGWDGCARDDDETYLFLDYMIIQVTLFRDITIS